MIDHPLRIDAHVIGDHIRRKSNAALPGARAQVFKGEPAAQVLGDIVGIERVRRGNRIRVAHALLDPLRSARALPQTDQPETGKAAVAQQVQLFIGDLVERFDPAAVFARKLFEPDVGILGNQYQARHPVFVGTVLFVLLVFAAAEGLHGDIGLEVPMGQVLADGFFAQKVHSSHNAGNEFFIQQVRPFIEDELELALQRIGRGLRRGAQDIEKGFPSARSASVLCCIGKISVEGSDQAAIGGRFERLIIHQVQQGIDRRVGVMRENIDQLFDRFDPPIGQSLQVLFNLLFPAIDIIGWELRDEFFLGRGNRIRSECLIHMRNGFAHDRCRGIMPDEQAQGLVDELHRVDIGCRYRLVPTRRHLGGKPAGSGIIRKGNAAIRLEKVRTKLIGIAGSFCDEHTAMITHTAHFSNNQPVIVCKDPFFHRPS